MFSSWPIYLAMSSVTIHRLPKFKAMLITCKNIQQKGLKSIIRRAQNNLVPLFIFLVLNSSCLSWFWSCHLLVVRAKRWQWAWGRWAGYLLQQSLCSVYGKEGGILNIHRAKVSCAPSFKFEVMFFSGNCTTSLWKAAVLFWFYIVLSKIVGKEKFLQP